MRPAQTRLTARASRAARARLVLKAHLWWLPGYPSRDGAPAGSVSWIAAAGKGRHAQSTALDGGSLHRATRALTELEGRFGNVLDDVLDAPGTWCAGARCTLELLKPRVHGNGRSAGGGPLEAGMYRANLVAEIRSAPAAVRSVLEAAAWIGLVKPARLERLAAWTLANTDAIENMHRALPAHEAQTASLHLALLAEEAGAHRVEPLVQLLANAALYDVPTNGEQYGRALAQSLRKKERLEARPSASLGPEFAAWTTSLLGEEPARRRRALALLGALDLAPIAREWAAWWARVARCERGSYRAAERESLAQKATRLAANTPRSVYGKHLVTRLESALDWDDRTYQAALRALAELPAWENKVPVRVAFFERWCALVDDDHDGDGNLAQLLRAFTRYLVATRALGTRQLRPWADVLGRKGVAGGWPDREFLRDVPRSKWALCFEVFARFVRTDEDDVLEDRVEALFALAPFWSAGPVDAARAAAFAMALAPHAKYTGASLWVGIAMELGGGDLAEFARVAAAFAREMPDRAHLATGLRVAREAWGDGVARALLFDSADRLLRHGQRLAALAAIGVAAGAASETDNVDASWTAAYPVWLASALRALAEADPGAEQTARRLLGEDMRTAAAVRRELAHLTRVTQLTQPAQAEPRVVRRMANLHERLERGSATPPAKRARLVAKIERAANRAKLASMERAIEAQLRARLPAYLGIETAPDWLFEERTLEKVVPIPELEPSSMRAVALRILRERAGPPPWDLRAAPENAAFLERLGRAGIDVAPWVDGTGTQRVTTRSGKIVELGLEDDPLQILDMGRHFSTCLSPDGFNYFSAFANAADINKRVLYARDLRGAVVGRCLLALTGTGGLLAFHAYAHDAELGFHALVKDFANDLAERMHTTVIDAGQVPLLVATDWYDDGPIDLGGRFVFLQPGSPFRNAIETQTPDAFVAEAARAFAPLPLGALTLPLLITLGELDEHPHHVVPLLPHLEASGDVPLATLTRAARLLTAAGRTEEAARGLLPRLTALARRTYENDQGQALAAIASVGSLSAPEGLRLLRATRPRGVRSWHDETHPERIEIAACAHEALHRPRRAIELFRYAAEIAWDKTSARRLRARADALEAEIRE